MSWRHVLTPGQDVRSVLLCFNISLSLPQRSCDVPIRVPHQPKGNDDPTATEVITDREISNDNTLTEYS